MELLNVNNLNVYFDQPESSPFHAVIDVSFTLDTGEILGIIGESGSGKSVASQALTRLIPNAKISGQCHLHAEKSYELINLDEDNLRNIRRTEVSYIFQEPMTALNPLIRCGQQILESYHGARSNKQQVLTDLLDKVELHDHNRIIKSYPHELSGGQRQRIMIAMALAKQPKLIIADEPTTALDIAVQNEILSLLSKLAMEENLGIIFITHDLLSLRGFANKIAVMYRGEIVETGPAVDILQTPSHAYTKALIKSRATYNKKGNLLAEIQDMLDIESNPPKFIQPEEQKLNTVKSSNEVLIQFKNIDKWYQNKSSFKKAKTEVLNKVSFEIFKGDSLGLIGESGSGKSTIAKILLRLINANNGEILINNIALRDIKQLPNLLQLVFQDPYSSLNPKHKIGTALIEVLQSVNKDNLERRARDLLEVVGLTATDFEKYPHEFSGGQRQRVCIAKALAKNPKIIVLDEAVSALDVSVQAKILNLLNQLKISHDLSYLLISHDMNVVSYFCNRIVVLRNGQIQEIGETDELIKHPKSEYTKQLLESSIY